MDNGFKEWGGYMGAKISKLEEQFIAASDPFRETNLFNGISVFVNGLTNPSSEEIKRIMMVHGGIYHHYQRRNTTYIIASCLPDVKVRNMNTSNIISANWITDCLKENRILDFTKYLLYTNQNTTQPKLLFQIENDKKHKEHEEQQIDDGTKILSDLKKLNEQIQINEITESTEITDLTGDDSNDAIPKEEDEDLEKFEINNFFHVDGGNGNTEAKTAVNPKFLSEFYNNSRLHHIATLGAGFKQYITELRENTSTTEFPAREELKLQLPKMDDFEKHNSKIIMHIDMDCFFVSVGLRNHKHLIGHPVAVTHSKGGKESAARAGVDRQLELELYMKRLETKLHENIKNDKIKSGFEGNESISLSEIASCSYEARKLGVRNGMFVGQALKLCPQLKTIPYDFEGYKEVAYTLYNTIAQYTLDIEAVSCDEMFVDLTNLLNDLEVYVMDFVTYVREEVKRKTGCSCSVGIGENRLQARMATKRAKPDGQFFLNPVLDSVVEYMAQIPISELPGVGHSTNYTLKQHNWVTCGDLQKISLTKLQNDLGKKFGETLYQYCRGIDSRPLAYGQIRKSVSAEVNYGIRFTETNEMQRFLKQLCVEVHSRLIEIKRKGKCITLKLMVRSKDAPVESSKYMGHGVCDQISKSTTISAFTDDLDKITKTVIAIMTSLNIPARELRGIGIQITKLNYPDEENVKKDNVIMNMFNKIIEKQRVERENYADIVEINTQKPKTVTSRKLEKITIKKPAETSPNKMRKLQPRKCNSKPPPATSNLLNMIQNPIIAKKRPLESNNDELPGIDMEVLAELPSHIREEILRERKYYGNISPNKTAAGSPPRKKITVEAEFLEALPLYLRKELEKEINSNKDKFSISPKKKLQVQPSTSAGNCNKVDLQTISDDNIFCNEEVSNLIENWVNSTETPEQCDVKILIMHFTEFIRARKIYTIYEPAVQFHKLITENRSCKWHYAYQTVILNLQAEMMKHFGGRLDLNENINCDMCHM